MAQDVPRYEEARIEAVLDQRYTLRREIARGGQGVVFEGEHRVTGARVAIKTLTRAGLELPEAHQRMLREARAIGAVRHPNVVAIHDAGTCAQHGPYLALEMIEGRPLDGILLVRQRLSVAQAVVVTCQLCDALAAVHRHGIIHRDVKPSNLLISSGGSSGDRVELIDFGVASDGAASVASAKITRVGELLGTVEYMSPEQLMGTAPVEAPSDVYAAASVLYECLTGEVPYAGAPTVVMAQMISGTKPAPVRNKREDVSPKLEAVIVRGLEIDPRKRFASVLELAQACRDAVGFLLPPLALLDAGEARMPAAAPAASEATPSPAMPPPVPSVAKRRQFVRAPYVTPVRVRTDKSSADGRTEDISEGGILMVMEQACADGERVRVRLPVPVSGRVVEVEGIAKWIKTRRGQRAIGVEFVAVPDDVRSEIRAYVKLMTGS
jgi:serine/threonine-protein kinase